MLRIRRKATQSRPMMTYILLCLFAAALTLTAFSEAFVTSASSVCFRSSSALLFGDTPYLDDTSNKPPNGDVDDDTSTTEGSARLTSATRYLKDLADSEQKENANDEERSVDRKATFGKSLEKSLTFDSEDGEKEKTTTPTGTHQSALERLLRIAASTGRGEFATASQSTQASDLIAVLEGSNPTQEPANSPLINGRWELLYSSTQLFRSSPFFMAGRAVCATGDEARQYDWFCDMHRKALAISNVGPVRQIVSPTRIVSEFEVRAGAVPFVGDLTPLSYSGGLPVSIDGAIVSSADLTPTDDGTAWELFMDTVEIKGSNVPGLRQVLDGGLRLRSRQLGSLLERTIDSYTNPRPIFATTYLSETIRISRDQDGKVFVYGKESDDTTPTDYSKIDSDLGLLKLLEGLNDAVIKFYI
jgi:PAP_fibrillin